MTSQENSEVMDPSIRTEKSDDHRAPGGTPRPALVSHPSGTRTPRKVQWTDEPSSLESVEECAPHMLDEHGMDPEAFQDLTEALERHRKGTPLTKVHYYPPQPSVSETSEAPGQGEQNTHAGSSSHKEDQNGYASTLYPSSPSSSRFFRPTAFTPSKPSREVPDNYIGQEEVSGLPGTKDLRNFSLKKAQDVVQEHFRRGSDRWTLAHGSHLESARRKKEKEPLRQAPPEAEKDVENEGETREFSGGGGILSALLNLYQQPNESHSGWSSRRSSWDGEGASDNGSAFRLIPPSPKGTTHSVEKSNDKSERVYNRKRRLQLPDMFGRVTRPAVARNAGGVIGPLIASTGSIASIAAPQSSQLQPSLKRPGYKLTRYSYETKTVTNPRPPPLQQRHSSYFSDLHQQSPWEDEGDDNGDTDTPARTPPATADSFYQSSNKSNLSGFFGGYVSSIRSGGRRSGYSTPVTPGGSGDQAGPSVSSLNKKRNKRKKAEVFITRHIAQVIRREEFLMKLTRAMMMFGGPTHRLQAQIQSAARVLDLELSFMYFPDLVLLSFDDNGTGTSHIKLIRQTSSLNLAKLNDAFSLYWKVIHDKLSVSDASVELDGLMSKKPYYNQPMLVFIGGMCSASICTVSFGGSFIDACMSFPLGAILVLIQLLSVRNVLYTYVFEVTVTTLFSFIAAALAATHHLCYSAITSSSVVLILPGFLVLTGALELMSRHIVSGSVRLLFAVVYALFLGFGFAIGAELYELFTSHSVFGAEDYTCSLTHDPSGPWYQRTPSIWWAFLTVPMYSAFLSMRNHAPWNTREMFLLIAISSIGWVTNYFTGRRFVGQSDIIAAVGAFAVGLVSNLYARIFCRNAFVVMITGILFQLPSGLGSGGLLSYASEQASGSTESYISGFRTALKLVSVAIGLTIGLGLSLVLTHPIQSRKREAGIFSL